MTTKNQELELHIGIDEYHEHLVATGQRPSTVGTAKRSLALFEEALGGKKVIAKIMPVHVAGFFKSEAATMQPGKDGPKPRAAASVLQIRRIVRSALVWWSEQGYIETVPLPNDEKRFVREKTTAEATEPTADVADEPAATAEPTTEPATEPVADTTADEPAAERQYVPCHKNHQRRAVELCMTKGCLSKAAAAKCKHWQQWLAEGKV